VLFYSAIMTFVTGAALCPLTPAFAQSSDSDSQKSWGTEYAGIENADVDTTNYKVTFKVIPLDSKCGPSQPCTKNKDSAFTRQEVCGGEQPPEICNNKCKMPVCEEKNEEKLKAKYQVDQQGAELTSEQKAEKEIDVPCPPAVTGVTWKDAKKCGHCEVCKEATGACEQEADAKLCPDNGCWQNGKCVRATGVCQWEGKCDPVDPTDPCSDKFKCDDKGICGNAPEEAIPFCDDGNPCTEEQCNAGQCTYGLPDNKKCPGEPTDKCKEFQCNLTTPGGPKDCSKEVPKTPPDDCHKCDPKTGDMISDECTKNGIPADQCDADGKITELTSLCPAAGYLKPLDHCPADKICTRKKKVDVQCRPGIQTECQECSADAGFPGNCCSVNGIGSPDSPELSGQPTGDDPCEGGCFQDFACKKTCPAGGDGEKWEIPANTPNSEKTVYCCSCSAGNMTKTCDEAAKTYGSCDSFDVKYYEAQPPKCLAAGGFGGGAGMVTSGNATGTCRATVKCDQACYCGPSTMPTPTTEELDSSGKKKPMIRC